MAIGRARGFWVTRWRDDSMSEGVNALLGTKPIYASESISPSRPEMLSTDRIAFFAALDSSYVGKGRDNSLGGSRHTFQAPP